MGIVVDGIVGVLSIGWVVRSDEEVEVEAGIGVIDSTISSY